MTHKGDEAFVRLARRSIVSFVVFVLVGSLAACHDKSPTQPEDPNSLESQIKALFTPGVATRDAALTQLADIRQQIALGATSQARAKTLALVDFTMTSLRDGKLVGGTAPTAGNAASRLVNGLYQLIGLDPPNLPDGSLSGDAAAKVIGPEGGSVVTPSGAAAVQIPPGAIPQSVLVTITQLPAPTAPGAGPLPTTLKQYPPYYEYSTYPTVTQFSDSVRVGVCQVSNPSSPLYPPEPHERLRLAHAVGSGIQILDRVDVTDLVQCGNVSAGIMAASGQTGWSTLFSRLAAGVADVISPRELFAAHGGLGGKTKSFSPFGAVDPGSPAISSRLVASELGVCALDPTGALFCWGDALTAASGASSGNITSPKKVSTTQTFVALSAGNLWMCGVTATGALHCWGDNQNGQYGYGATDTLDSYTPRPAVPALGLTWVATGGVHGCGIVFSGDTYCWGQNASGNIGNAAVSGVKTTPVPVSGSLQFTSLSLGYQHSCGLVASGAAYCWGLNSSGQLGNGSTTNATIPTAVSGGLTFKKISAYQFSTCGIATDGATYCWGMNNTFQLGSDTGQCTTNGVTSTCPSLVPLKVSGGLSFVDIALGKSVACGLVASGAAYCWGANAAGALGTGTVGPAIATPQAVSGGLSFVTITAGFGQVCGAIADGTIYCWGFNGFGEIGQGTTVNLYSTPQRVNGVKLK